MYLVKNHGGQMMMGLRFLCEHVAFLHLLCFVYPGLGVLKKKVIRKSKTMFMMIIYDLRIIVICNAVVQKDENSFQAKAKFVKEMNEKDFFTSEEIF